jgi:hypothetical protein
MGLLFGAFSIQGIWTDDQSMFPYGSTVLALWSLAIAAVVLLVRLAIKTNGQVKGNKDEPKG